MKVSLHVKHGHGASKETTHMEKASCGDHISFWSQHGVSQTSKIKGCKMRMYNALRMSCK